MPCPCHPYPSTRHYIIFSLFKLSTFLFCCVITTIPVYWLNGADNVHMRLAGWICWRCWSDGDWAGGNDGGEEMAMRWLHFNNARWKKENRKIVYISNVYRFPCLSFHVISSKEMYPTRPIIYTKYIILCLPRFISWTWWFSWLLGYFIFNIPNHHHFSLYSTVRWKRKREKIENNKNTSPGNIYRLIIRSMSSFLDQERIVCMRMHSIKWNCALTLACLFRFGACFINLAKLLSIEY